MVFLADSATSLVFTAVHMAGSNIEWLSSCWRFDILAGLRVRHSDMYSVEATKVFSKQLAHSVSFVFYYSFW